MTFRYSIPGRVHGNSATLSRRPCEHNWESNCRQCQRQASVPALDLAPGTVIRGAGQTQPPDRSRRPWSPDSRRWSLWTRIGRSRQTCKAGVAGLPWAAVVGRCVRLTEVAKSSSSVGRRAFLCCKCYGQLRIVTSKIRFINRRSYPISRTEEYIRYLTSNIYRIIEYYRNTVCTHHWSKMPR